MLRIVSIAGALGPLAACDPTPVCDEYEVRVDTSIADTERVLLSVTVCLNPLRGSSSAAACSHGTIDSATQTWIALEGGLAVEFGLSPNPATRTMTPGTWEFSAEVSPPDEFREYGELSLGVHDDAAGRQLLSLSLSLSNEPCGRVVVDLDQATGGGGSGGGGSGGGG